VLAADDTAGHRRLLESQLAPDGTLIRTADAATNRCARLTTRV
jgi:hypothetical protein